MTKEHEQTQALGVFHQMVLDDERFSCNVRSIFHDHQMFLANTLTSSKLLSVKDSSVGDHEKHKALGCAEREFTTKKITLSCSTNCHM